MKHIVYGQDHDEFFASLERYERYLQGVMARLPNGAREFVSQPHWHRDGADHRVLHDSWVESVRLVEVAVDAELQTRRVDVVVTLLGPHHDFRTTISYVGIRRYQMSSGDSEIPYGRPWNHGDWLIDELTLSETGGISHEIWFSTGAIWHFESHDLTCSAEPIGSQ